MNDFWNLLKNIPYYQKVMANVAAGKPGWSIIPMAFAYSTTFLPAQIPAVANNNATNNIAIQSDSDFVILAQSFWAWTNAATAWAYATAIIPNMTVLLTDTGSSKQFSDNPISLGAQYGTGQFPFVLPQPIYLAAKSNLSIKLTTNDTANTYTVNLVYHGIKVYTTEGS